MTVHYSNKEDKFWIRDGDGIVWFDSPLEAKDADRKLEAKAAVRVERDQIAAWLRRIGKRQLASAIERGDHLTGVNND
jgi:hypothetical protein